MNGFDDAFIFGEGGQNYQNRGEALLRANRTIETPDDALAVQFVKAMLYLSVHPDYVDESGRPRVERLEEAKDLLRTLVNADLYVWTTAMIQTGFLQDIPDHIITPQLVNETTMWIPGHRLGDDNLEIAAWLHVPRENGGTLSAVLGGKGVETRLIGLYDIPPRAHFPHDFAEKDRASVGTILAAFSFLQSRYIDIRAEVPSRAERRRMGWTPETSPHPRFVTFRRRQIEEAEPQGGEVEWSKRWWVRGHHRAQWYPSIAAHRLIWISGYVKGPEDRPFVPSVGHVIR